MSQYTLLSTAQRSAVDNSANKKRGDTAARLLVIGGKTVPMTEVCVRSGIDSKRVSRMYGRGKREWADYGIAP